MVIDTAAKKRSYPSPSRRAFDEPAGELPAVIPLAPRQFGQALDQASCPDRFDQRLASAPSAAPSAGGCSRGRSRRRPRRTARPSHARRQRATDTRAELPSWRRSARRKPPGPREARRPQSAAASAGPHARCRGARRCARRLRSRRAADPGKPTVNALKLGRRASSHRRGDGGGIDAAREEGADRHVGKHVLVDGIEHARARFLDPVGFAKRRFELVSSAARSA